ncbi:MAG: hypothetical protein WCP85_08790 [Mariniphaga sp.]
MNVAEKRDFIHSHLDQIEESMINQFYDALCDEETLKTKLISRAEKSEGDIQAGRLYSRAELEQRLNQQNK